MSLMHHHSCECAKSELDLFTIPGTQTSILKGQWVEYIPVSSLTPSAPIDFLISASGEQYIDLNHTRLYVKCKILNGKDEDLKPTSNVAPVNLILHSLFNEITVTLNDTIISHTNPYYPYRALIETLLNYGEDAITTQLTNALFFKDTAGHMNATDTTNEGFTKRQEFFKESRSVELMGPIHSDIFFQSKYLLNGVAMKLRLNRNRNTFCLMTSDLTENYKIHIEECKLYVRKVIISPSVLLGHAHALVKGSAKYPLDRTVCKTISIPAGMRNTTQDNLFFGQIPKNLILALVDNSAFNGDYMKNPFHFHHYDLNYLALYLDNEQYPFKPLQLDFKNHLYLNAYNTLFSGTGKMFKDVGGIINREDYANGYTFYCYDLSPDLETQDHYSLTRHGDLRLDLQFANPLPHTTVLIIYAVFENILEINHKRKVIYNYTS